MVQATPKNKENLLLHTQLNYYVVLYLWKSEAYGYTLFRKC